MKKVSKHSQELFIDSDCVTLSRSPERSEGEAKSLLVVIASDSEAISVGGAVEIASAACGVLAMTVGLCGGLAMMGEKAQHGAIVMRMPGHVILSRSPERSEGEAKSLLVSLRAIAKQSQLVVLWGLLRPPAAPVQ